MKGRFTRYIVIWIMLIATVWAGDRFIRGVLLTADEPRPVTPRGQLAEFERSATELFDNAAPSVVYIFTETTPAGLFGTQQPQGGAGSGFIWDGAAGRSIAEECCVDIQRSTHQKQTQLKGSSHAKFGPGND